jgi:hypothetical protein
MTNVTSTLTNREQLDALLDLLNEWGHGTAALIDAAGEPALLTAWESDGGEGCSWDAFGMHPYNTDGEPDGLARQHDMETLAADGELEVEGAGFDVLPVILAVNLEREHPGLDRLRFPLTVMHQGVQR